MLKQSRSRNPRGFKAKHGYKIFILIAVGIWLLYQFKHSHDHKKKAYDEESVVKIFEKLETAHDTRKLGRKELQPWISKPEKIKERSSGGDDDIVGRDRDKVEEEDSEEVEDLIDEEDKEKEEGSEEENLNLLEDQDHNEGEKDKHVTTYK